MVASCTASRLASGFSAVDVAMMSWDSRSCAARASVLVVATTVRGVASGDESSPAMMASPIDPQPRKAIFILFAPSSLL